MRFETRYDTWLVAILAATGIVLLGLPTALYVSHAVGAGQIWTFCFGPLVMLFVFSATLPQYYEVRDEGLFIRQGWRKVLLPYAGLREVHAARSFLSAPVFSTKRIYVTAVPGGHWILALAEQDRFLAEVRRRAPQLQAGAERDGHQAIANRKER